MKSFISNDFKDADFSDVIGKHLYVLSLYFNKNIQENFLCWMVIDKFSPQYEYIHPNRGQLLVSVK